MDFSASNDFSFFLAISKLNSIALKSIGFEGDAEGYVLLGTKSKDYGNLVLQTGNTKLKVTKGSLRNKEISKEDKLEFNKYVLPELIRADNNLTAGFSGIIECRLHNNKLKEYSVRLNN